MYEFDEKDLPYIRTRRALLVLDVQNDFLDDDGRLPVKEPSDFLEKIQRLTPHFRSNGYVFWIRTLFETSRPVNAQDPNGEKIITNNEIQSLTRGPSQSVRRRIDVILNDDDVGAQADSSETFLTVEAGQDESGGLSTVLDHANAPPCLPLRSSPGVDFYLGLEDAMDKGNDIFIQKTYYSAFKDGALVQSLRGKFVTDLYICGVLTNISIFATAMEAAKHGYAITIVEDALGYRSKVRHDVALRQLVRMTGCEIISSEDLIEEFRANARPTSQKPASPKRSKDKQSRFDLEDAMSSLHVTESSSQEPLSSQVSTSEGDVSPSLPARTLLQSIREGRENPHKPSNVSGSKQKPARVKAKIRTLRHSSHSTSTAAEGSAQKPKPTSKSDLIRSSSAKDPRAPSIAASGGEPVHRHSGSSLADSLMTRVPRSGDPSRNETDLALPATDHEQMRKQSIITSETCFEGDTHIVHDVIPGSDLHGIFEKLRDEVLWQKMSHQGGDVPRLIAVQGDVQEDETIPVYRHPADESPSLLPFTPTVLMIRKHVEAQVGHELNHVLIQLYRSGIDHISEHSDKTLDIVFHTFIANVSFGAERTMIFRTKRPMRDQSSLDEENVASNRESCRIPLPHNSMCKMGLKTNMKWLHSIRQDERMDKEKSAAELAFQGARISLTFRKIGTFLDQKQHRIWGQGATSKTKITSKSLINGATPEAERLLLAFGKENRSSNFDWQDVYGMGFDVLHLTNKYKLYCSGDNIADLRVKFMLAEYGLDWVEGTLSVPFKWQDFNSDTNNITRSTQDYPPIVLIDNIHNTTVTGEYAVMLYIDALAGSKMSSRTPEYLALQYTRLQQATQLLRIWRATPFDIQPLQREARLWVSYVSDTKFIAGDIISIADFSLFPVLLEIANEWDNLDEDFDKLAQYWKRMRSRDCVVKVLGPFDPSKCPKNSSKLLTGGYEK